MLACTMLGHTTLYYAARCAATPRYAMPRYLTGLRYATLCYAAPHNALARLSTPARASGGSSVFECGPCFTVCDWGACAGLGSPAMACAQPAAWASVSRTLTQAQQARPFLLPGNVTPIQQQLVCHILSLVLCSSGARLGWARRGYDMPCYAVPRWPTICSAK
jgi:hypothetical protein